jgi:tetratricopeptide (TPR) repeat protein
MTKGIVQSDIDFAKAASVVWLLVFTGVVCVGSGLSTVFAGDAAPASATPGPVSPPVPPKAGKVAATQPGLAGGLLRTNDAARLSHVEAAGRIENLIAESKANPSDIGKRLLVAAEYERRNSPHSRDLDHAIREYQQVLEYETNNADALFGLARVYYALGQLTKAEGSIDRAVQFSTNRAPLLVMRAEILLGQKRYDEALQTVQQALALEPKSARAYYVLGSLNDSWKPDPDTAIACYSKAIEIDPTISEAYFFRALQYDVKGLTVEAKTDLRTVERLDAESKWAGLSRQYLERMNQ